MKTNGVLPEILKFAGNRAFSKERGGGGGVGGLCENLP